MKKKIISFIVALALAATATFGLMPSLYENSGEAESEFEEGTEEGSEDGSIPAQNELIEINEENFPDENFRSVVAELEAAVAENETPDGSLSESELAQITSISVRSMSVKSLKGIEFFTALEVLDCAGNDIEELDLSFNTNLKELYCSENGLHELDLSALQQLLKLDCGYNELSELDLTQNSMLTDLHLSGNPVTELDLSTNPDLWRFEASHTQLTSLTIENHNPYDSENGMEFEQFELNGSLYTVSGCAYTNTGFDLSTLPGSFDAERVTEWNDTSHEGTLLTDVNTDTVFTYTYEVIGGITAEFSIAFTAAHTLTAVQDTSGLCQASSEIWQCTECGKYFADENGGTEADVGHFFSKYTVELEPTCTTEGIAVKICAVCGYEEREALYIFPHIAEEGYTFDNNYHSKTCVNCKQEIEKEEHTFDEETNRCTVCGAERDHVHSFEYVEETPPTCAEEGVKAHYICTGCGKCFSDDMIFEILPEELIIPKTEHQFKLKNDENGHWEECTVCGEKKAEPSPHEFETERIEPNCYQDGYIVETCHVCGFSTGMKTIPATGEHNFGTEYGSDDNYHWFSCTTEGCTARERVSEHQYTVDFDKSKSPTCDKKGITAYVCDDCGHIKEELIPTVEHTFNICKPVNDYAHVSVCSVCGKYNDFWVGHTFDNGIIINDEFPCKDAVKVYTCKECGYKKNGETVPATANHKFDSYTDHGAVHTKTCSICGTESEPEEHDYIPKIEKDSTCYELGVMSYTCDCGNSYTEAAGKLKPHNFSAEFTLDSQNRHHHKCTTEGCTAEDIHDSDECTYTDPVPETSTSAETTAAETTPGASGGNTGGSLDKEPVINVTWPTTAGVVLNPYKMKIKMSPSSNGSEPMIFEDPDSEGETILSSELAFVNNGDCLVNVSVTGSVYAVSTVDRNGNILLDDEGNPVTTPSNKITIASSPIRQPQWNSTGTDIISGEPRNSVFIYLEATDRLVPGETKGIYSGIYDSSNKSQMLLSSRETTKELFSISPKEGDKAGVTNLKIFGDISTDPALDWEVVAKTDTVKISLVFDVSLAETDKPKPASDDSSDGSSETTPNEPADVMPEENSGALTEETAEPAAEEPSAGTSDNTPTEEPEEPPAEN